jgi:hypothetical protein
MLALVVVGRYIRASFCYAYRGPAPTGHSPSRRGTTASRAAQTQTQRATRMSGTTPRLSDYKHDVPSLLQQQRMQRRSSHNPRYRSTKRAPAMHRDATPPSPTGPGIRARLRIMALSVPHYCTFCLVPPNLSLKPAYASAHVMRSSHDAAAA